MSVSYSTLALVLIRLEARAGQKVGVRELADHIGADPAAIYPCLDQLEQSSGVYVDRIGDIAFCAWVMPKEPKERTCA